MKIVQPVTIELRDAERCIRHYQFEIFVRQTLFPLTRYDLVLKKDDGQFYRHDRIEAIKQPHLKLKSRFSQRLFYVDVRYVPRISAPEIQWCEPSDFTGYQELDSLAPVFILVGEGPQPAAPHSAYLFAVNNASNHKMLRTDMEKYNIDVASSVDEEYLMSPRLSY